jgi:plasmid stabilization system protein ParE
MGAAKRPRFLLDLAEELTWLKNHAGAEVAERWYGAFLATLEFIEKNSHVGRERTDLSPPGVRSWRLNEFPRWLVFYGVKDNSLIVFYRVRSGTMNLVVMKMES